MFNKIAAFALAGLIATASAAHADTITYTLNNGGSLASTPGNYGQITLTDISGGVTVTETLAGSEYYVVTGAGNALSFNLLGTQTLAQVTAAMSGLTPGFTIDSTSPDSASPFGSFEFAIVCGIPPCAQGGGASSYPNTLTFTLAGYTSASFAQLSTGGSPNAYFASDICIQKASGGGCVASGTGNVGATDPGTTHMNPTPEPSSLIMLGTGVIGAAGLLRRRLAA